MNDITQLDVLHALEVKTQCRWTVTEKSADTHRQEGLDKLERGDMSGAGNLIIGDLYGLGHGTVDPSRMDNETLGLVPRSVHYMVDEVLAAA